MMEKKIQTERSNRNLQLYTYFWQKFNKNCLPFDIIEHGPADSVKI